MAHLNGHNITGETSTGKSHEPQPEPAKHESKRTTPSHGNGLLADHASIQPGQHNTRITSQSRSHGRKVQLPLHKDKPKNSGDQPTPHLQTTQLQAHAWHL
ncbi:hypothetical protein Taro_012584 [Colocasia esculenta]|uniref:Uncharacterized protein n=1 Tax=Colocasia esculenta TaxID=4460 RepID=A0A843U961_COLES|nr:hypothetical protein [Colocasia esculenta]